MRKLFLVLLAMTMVATMAFAQTQVEYELSGEATATFGVNLDGAEDADDDVTVSGPTTGFSLSNDADLKVTFVEESTEEYGEGDVYAWMEIEEFEFVVDDDDGVQITGGEVSATLFLGPAYIVIATAGNDVDQAEIGLNVAESIFGAADELDNLGGMLSDGDAGETVAVGFTVPDLFNIEAALASVSSDGEGGGFEGENDDQDNDWSDNLYNNYVAAIYTETTIAGFTLDVDLAATLSGDKSKGTTDDDGFEETEAAGDFGDNGFVGIGVGYEMALNEMMTLKPYVGVDLFNNARAGEADDSTSGYAGAFDYEIIGGANVEWGADDMEVFNNASNGDTQGGVGLEVGLAKYNLTAGETYDGDVYGTDFANADDSFYDVLWVRAGAAEESGDDGFLPIVGGALLVEYATASATYDGDAVDDSGIDFFTFGLEVDADLGVVSPFLGMMYGNKSYEDSDIDAENGFTLDLGTDINVIDATTFTIAYSSGNLLYDDENAAGDTLDGIYDGDQYTYAAAMDDVTSKLGALTISTKIEY